MIDLRTKQFNTVFPTSSEVYFLHAHPDDESFLTAGMLSQLIQRGHQVHVVYVCAHPTWRHPSTYTRYREAKNACRILGACSVTFLHNMDFPYRKVGELSRENMLECFHSKIESIAKSAVIVGYDKNGGYGHIDHRCVYRLGIALHECYQCEYREVTINRDQINKWLSRNVGQSQSYLPDQKYWSKEFGLPESEISHYYQLTREELSLKRKALAAHQTQMNVQSFPLSLNDRDFDEVFGKEYCSTPEFNRVNKGCPIKSPSTPQTPRRTAMS